MSGYWSALARAAAPDRMRADAARALPREPQPFEQTAGDEGFVEIDPEPTPPRAARMRAAAPPPVTPEVEPPPAEAPRMPSQGPAPIDALASSREVAPPPRAEARPASNVDPDDLSPEPRPERHAALVDDPAHASPAREAETPRPAAQSPAPLTPAAQPATAEPTARAQIVEAVAKPVAPTVPEAPQEAQTTPAVPAVVVAALAEQVAAVLGPVEAAAPPPIVITIERLDVRLGDAAAPQPVPRRARPAPAVTLDQFLRRPGDAR